MIFRCGYRSTKVAACPIGLLRQPASTHVRVDFLSNTTFRSLHRPQRYLQQDIVFCVRQRGYNNRAPVSKKCQRAWLLHLHQQKNCTPPFYATFGESRSKAS